MTDNEPNLEKPLGTTEPKEEIEWSCSDAADESHDIEKGVDCNDEEEETTSWVTRLFQGSALLTVVAHALSLLFFFSPFTLVAAAIAIPTTGNNTYHQSKLEKADSE
jgi:hypothetical protein